MTLVKICGLMSETDVIASSRADYQGFVVGTGTRRSLSIEVAGYLTALAERPSVAVTTSTDARFIVDMVRKVRPLAVQLNGPVNMGTLGRVRREVERGGGRPRGTGGRAGPGACEDCVYWTPLPLRRGQDVHDHAVSARSCRTSGRHARWRVASRRRTWQAIAVVRPISWTSRPAWRPTATRTL